MIKHVRVTNWRAYEYLDLQLDAPVVFVVAPNGVGKSSLLEAVRWGLFGRFPGKVSGSVVRLGSQEATVQLSVELGPDNLAEISRSLTVKGKTSFSATVAGSAVTEAEYVSQLVAAWGADEDLLFSLLFGDSGSNASSSFPVRDHLVNVFGVTPLNEAIEAIDGRAQALRREITELRAEEVDEKAIRDAEAGVEELTAEVNEQAAELEAAREAVKLKDEEKQAALLWEQFRNQYSEYQAQVSGFLQRLADIANQGHEADPHLVVAELEDEATAALDRTRRALSDEQSGADSASLALQMLTDDVEVCPTCLRPLSEAERTFARGEHEATHGRAAASLDVTKDAIRAAEKRLGTIREISRELREVRVPAAPTVSDPGVAALESARQAQERWEAASHVQGAVQARLLDSKRRLELLLDAAAENKALVAAYREEITLQMAREVFSRVVDHYMQERIGPLTAEVSRRWKLLFGTEGLRLEPDGTLLFQTDAGELELPDLSGGERVMALFITRLLLVSAASRATSLWLDEPLEHLDPGRRAIVAATLVKAVKQGALKQVVVSTYEERLVRRLASTAPQEVQIAHVRTSDPRL